VSVFDIKLFEQFFKERTLKKALRLFEKGELEFIERSPSFGYNFLVGSEKLFLKKKADKLLKYICSCGDDDFCEHLGASMFYFQQEALGIAVKNKNPTKEKGVIIRSNLQHLALKKSETERALKFIKQNENKLSLIQLLNFLKDKKTLTLSDLYVLRFSYCIKPFTLQNKLDQKDIDTLQKELTSLYKKFENDLKKPEDQVLLNLSFLQAFMPIFNLRFTGKEELLLAMNSKVVEKLEEAFIKGLSLDQRKEWFRATLASIESNKDLSSEAFLFLIPRYAISAKNESELSLLSRVLKKRVIKSSYAYHLNKILIARFELALIEWKLFKTAFPLHYEGGEVELIIAKVELFFCGGSMDKAFILLEEKYEAIRMEHKIYYNEFLDYLIANARKYKNPEIEKKYLLESFIQRLFILPEDLERYLALLPEIERIQAIESLVEQIKAKSKGYYFDKISLILLKANKLDELTRELSSQNNKFSLVHQIALKKYPEYTPSFLTMYMRHLAETLRQDSIYNYQVKVFTEAKVYLDQLPKIVVIELIKKLLDQVGKTGHLYRYINEMYEYPFLKESENY
jgi:hypothetical protein